MLNACKFGLIVWIAHGSFISMNFEISMQVRFGVLNAGNFGVSQSRKRTFIWGVAPGSHLPAWPKPQHVFRSSQLTINLPGNVQVLTSCLQTVLLLFVTLTSLLISCFSIRINLPGNVLVLTSCLQIDITLLCSV